jgi:hypothetical protein
MLDVPLLCFWSHGGYSTYDYSYLNSLKEDERDDEREYIHVISGL